MSTRSDNDDSSVDRLEDGGEGVQESDQAQDRQDTHMEWSSSEDKDDKESNRNWRNAGVRSVCVVWCEECVCVWGGVCVCVWAGGG